MGSLANLDVSVIDFDEITPDAKNSWLDQGTAEFGLLVPLTDRQTKLAKLGSDDRALFRLYSMGVSTNRDDWVYDFTVSNLRDKALFFADAYNELLDAGDESFDPVIKWSRDLRNEFQRRRRIVSIFMVIRPAIFTDIQPPRERGELTIIRLWLAGQSPPLRPAERGVARAVPGSWRPR